MPQAQFKGGGGQRLGREGCREIELIEAKVWSEPEPDAVVGVQARTHKQSIPTCAPRGSTVVKLPVAKFARSLLSAGGSLAFTDKFRLQQRSNSAQGL